MILTLYNRPHLIRRNVKRHLALLFDPDCDPHAIMDFEQWHRMSPMLCSRLNWCPNFHVRSLRHLENSILDDNEYNEELTQLFNTLPKEREVFDFSYKIVDFTILPALTPADNAVDVRSGIVPTERADTSIKLHCDSSINGGATIEPHIVQSNDQSIVREQSYSKWYSINNITTIRLPRILGHAWNLLGRVFTFSSHGSGHIRTIELKQTTLSELTSKCSPLKSVSENYATLTSWKTNQALQIDPLLAEETIRWALIYFYSELNTTISDSDIQPLKL